jgi:hypothetical protein
MVRNYRKAMTFITSTWASGEHGPLAACVPAGMVSARERLALNRCSDRLFAVYIYIYKRASLFSCISGWAGRLGGQDLDRGYVHVCV